MVLGCLATSAFGELARSLFQGEAEDEALKQPEEAPGLQVLLIIGDITYSDACWRDTAAGSRPPRRSLGGTHDIVLDTGKRGKMLCCTSCLLFSK